MSFVFQLVMMRSFISFKVLIAFIDIWHLTFAKININKTRKKKNNKFGKNLTQFLLADLIDIVYYIFFYVFLILYSRSILDQTKINNNNNKNIRPLSRILDVKKTTTTKRLPTTASKLIDTQREKERRENKNKGNARNDEVAFENIIELCELKMKEYLLLIMKKS